MSLDRDVKKTKNLYLLVGKSGSGTTSIATALCKIYPNTSAVKSVTTKPNGHGQNTDYYFLTDEEYDAANLVQHASFAGHRYGATYEEVDAASWFVICPDGIQELREHYKNRPVVIIYLDATDDTRKARMLARGDSEEDVTKRINNEALTFGSTPPDVITAHIDANGCFESVLAAVHGIIFYAEAIAS